MNLICIGHAAYDITVALNQFPVENTKIRVDNRYECGGGPASNAAYLLGKWGLNPYFLGIIGKDEYGKVIKDEFNSVNVNTSYLEVNENLKTTSSFIIANTANGSRTVITYRPPLTEMKEVSLDFNPDIILLDGQEVSMSHKLLDKYPNAISIIDAGRKTDDIVTLSKKVSYVVCSKNFAEEVTLKKFDKNNTQTYFEIYNCMKNIFKGVVVITLESEGCLYEYNGSIKVMPSINVKAIDSTGAGDIFHGAFTYGIASNLNFEDTLKLANIAAGLSVTKIGGRNSIFKLEELREMYHELV